MNSSHSFDEKRATFRHRVPESVRRDLAERLQSEGDPAARAALYDEHALDRAYGVSRAQFRRFASRFPCARNSVPAALSPSAAEPGRPPAPPVRSPLADGFQAWLARAGDLLSDLARSLSVDNLEAWEHGARAALIARVVAVLAGDRSGPAIHEILTASGILTGLRRHEADPTRDNRGASSSAKNIRREFKDVQITPEIMRKAVRDLYGQDNWNVQPVRSAAEPRVAEQGASSPDAAGA